MKNPKPYKARTGPDPRLSKMGELQPYKAQEVAALLRVNVRVVYELIRSKKLQAVRVGRAWRIRHLALEKYLAGR